MAENKLTSPKLILIFVIVLFVLIGAISLFTYFSKPISIVASPTATLTPTLTQQQSPMPSVVSKKDFKNLLLSLPFNNSSKVLQVYTPEPSVDVCVSADDPYCISKGLGIDTELKLTVYDAKNKSYINLGNIQLISKTGNFGGLFVPFAITKDDNNIILKAHMGDPGAGGGSVDYGYAVIPVKEAMGENEIINSFLPVANWSAADFPFIGGFIHFYDSYSKVVYVNESNKTPHNSAPPYLSNNGAIMFHNLVINDIKKILEEVDTSYEIISVDEKNKILKFKAIKYTFSNDCPREEDSLSCAKKKITERTIQLP